MDLPSTHGHTFFVAENRGTYVIQSCDACGITLPRIGAIAPVSQPSCKPVPAGARLRSVP